VLPAWNNILTHPVQPLLDRHKRDFVDLPVSFERSFAGEYGWISPFVIEVKKYLGLEENEIPSKKPEIIPMLVERAALGIIEEGAHVGKSREAEKVAEMLIERKDTTAEEVWKCCAHLYSLESFLYKNLNEAMRLVGDNENENVWRSKISTLGPFCLLFWDDPFNRTLTLNRILYRGAELKPEKMVKYHDAVNNQDEYGSFQAFTSCSRNRHVAELYGNCLFIMNVEFAFINDISMLSRYPEEEEVIITPGVCFRVRDVQYDHVSDKYIIHLNLRQRFSGECDACLQS
jgi:hypothetical protein